jgi:hypothetical protein
MATKKTKTSATAGSKSRAKAQPAKAQPAKAQATKAQATKPKATARVRNVRPDRIDFRDLPFRPAVSRAPAATLFPDIALGVRHQQQTSACTGFALALVVEYLLRKAERKTEGQASPFMLYSMARRYDEFAGSADTGSSLRGALKGWHKHGACAQALWQGIDMPPAPKDPKDDWWLDAVNRPLGAYYRIAAKNIVDIHAALNEVGIVYASVETHRGWNAANDLNRRHRPAATNEVFAIPFERGNAGGHAIVFVGYDERGFLIQNSWGTGWGSHGYAILTYADWLSNAMDCWVAQLGVVTDEHREIARHNTLRADAKNRVTIAASTVLRDREISPFVVNLGNNGRLSTSGLFRTGEDDLRAMVDVHLAAARARWKLGGRPVDVCIYAHGGLVGEKSAAASAAAWIPLLYEAKIFPVFLMWETDLLSTVVNRLADAVRDIARPAGGAEDFWSKAERWWNERVERLIAPVGTELWREIKQNAQAMSQDADSGAVLLWKHFERSAAAQQPVRFHLVGHSAGSVVHAHIVEALARRGVAFESVSFMAPAIRRDEFDRLVRPRLADGTIRRYQQFHLTDKSEEDDPTCAPYRRSLLYLVSEAFEGGRSTPILGMQKYFDDYAGKLAKARVHVAPGAASQSTTHGGFDDDAATRRTIVDFIRAGSRSS